MKIERPRNTKKAGVIEFFTYKEGDSYVGVCLTFDLLEEGSDPVELARSLKDAAELHLETVIKNDLSEDLLNRYAPEEYWEKYFEAAANIKNDSAPASGYPVVSPYSSSTVAQIA